MKKILLTLSLLIFSCTQTINFNENEEYFTEVKEIKYYKGSPFTGVVESYYENGQLWVKATYKGGKFDGPYEAYYENGQLREKTTYKDGEVDGLYELYYENGQLRLKTTLRDEELNGIYERYYEDGQLYGISNWRNGKCISGDCF